MNAPPGGPHALVLRGEYLGQRIRQPWEHAWHLRAALAAINDTFESLTRRVLVLLPRTSGGAKSEKKIGYASHGPKH
jgi:hypothetical protein